MKSSSGSPGVVGVGGSLSSSEMDNGSVPSDSETKQKRRYVLPALGSKFGSLTYA